MDEGSCESALKESGELKDLNRKVGEEVHAASFGPIGETEALEMAALAMDYNPAGLWRGSPASGRPRLHPLWISMLINRVVDGLWPRAYVRVLRISHLGDAYLGSTLRISATCGAGGGSEGNALLTFQVTTEKEIPVAQGSVLIMSKEGIA